VKGNLWGHPEVNAGGDAWFPPAIDTKRGITYWGTGNPAPWAGTADFPSGSSRPGANLYTDSVLAVGLHDAKTGEPVWHIDVGQHKNDRLKKITGNTFVAPGPLGGVETPMAYADQTVYVPTVNNPATYLPRRSNFVLNFNPDRGTGELDAIDTTSGALRWKHSFTKSLFSGATVVNDLVFTATSDGVLYALDRANGTVLWSWAAPGGSTASRLRPVTPCWFRSGSRTRHSSWPCASAADRLDQERWIAVTNAWRARPFGAKAWVTSP